MTTEWNRPVSEDTQLAAPRRGGRGRIGLPSVRTGLPHRILAPAAIVLAVAALGALWAATAQPVTLEVDGMTRLVRTHRTDVESLLLDMGLNVNDVDRITPGPSTALGSVDEVGMECSRISYTQRQARRDHFGKKLEARLGGRWRFQWCGGRLQLVPTSWGREGGG